MFRFILNKAKFLLKCLLERLFYIFQSKQDLVIIDDAFPNLLTAFRIHEFNYYLENIKRIRVYCTCSSFKWLNDYRSFQTVKKEYANLYPKYISKIRNYHYFSFKSKLVYFVFLSNTYNHLKKVNTLKIPFVFTLYPGGGFQLNNDAVDQKLLEIFSSPMFKKVIVTSKVTYDYLLNKSLCSVDKIKFIYGVVSPTEIFRHIDIAKKKTYRINKSMLDVCFVAHKYKVKGTDKGYDTFIEVARKLISLVSDVRFHVVGNYDASDIDVSDISEFMMFYGTMKTNQFVDFYSSMDIILSPNKPFILNEGGFDGFPTGSCIEAGLNGVALFVTDDLKQNICFENKKDVVLINTKPDDIAAEILYFREHVSELQQLSINGRNKISQFYSSEVQLRQRLEIIKEQIIGDETLS